jgi:hypothetical protein
VLYDILQANRFVISTDTMLSKQQIYNIFDNYANFQKEKTMKNISNPFMMVDSIGYRLMKILKELSKKSRQVNNNNNVHNEEDDDYDIDMDCDDENETNEIEDVVDVIEVDVIEDVVDAIDENGGVDDEIQEVDEIQEDIDSVSEIEQVSFVERLKDSIDQYQFEMYKRRCIENGGLKFTDTDQLYFDTSFLI